MSDMSDITDAGQPETFACECGCFLFIIMYGGDLAQPKLKCHGCGACWSLSATQRQGD
jgi:MinD superfamily P-loop ATPase